MPKREKQIFQLLLEHYPDAKCGLDWTLPFELLVATILSAQCTDRVVNKVSPQLFAAFPTPQLLSKASTTEIERYIRSIGLFRSKAKNLQATAAILCQEYQGQVPKTMSELTKLPGVGRKTANVVLANAFGIHFGIAVDTHVLRTTKRLQLSTETTAQKVEQELMAKFPTADWGKLSHLLIHHGRQVCQARRPKCHTCFLTEFCTTNQILLNKPDSAEH